MQLHLLVTLYFHCSLLWLLRYKGHSQNRDIVPRTGNLPVILGLHFVFPPPPATSAQLLISPSRTSDLCRDPISYSCFIHFPTWQLLLFNSAFLNPCFEFEVIYKCRCGWKINVILIHTKYMQGYKILSAFQEHVVFQMFGHQQHPWCCLGKKDASPSVEILFHSSRHNYSFSHI